MLKYINIEEGVSLLEKGEIFISPTDTVCGIFSSLKGLGKIYELKRRDKKKPIGCFCSDIEMVSKFLRIPDFLRERINKIWPGQVTLILNVIKNNIYNIKEKTMAIRIPNVTEIINLIRKRAAPVFVSSANLSGGKEFFFEKDLLSNFPFFSKIPFLKVDLRFMKFSNNVPSTIIDITKNKIRLIRGSGGSFLELYTKNP